MKAGLTTQRIEFHTLFCNQASPSKANISLASTAQPSFLLSQGSVRF